MPDPETLLPLEHPFCDPPQITVTNPAALPSAFFLNRHTADDFHHIKHFFHSAHFCDYGPYPTLGAQPPGAFYTTLDAAYIYPLFGDDRGEAYMKSLWDFIDDEEELKEWCEKKSNELTRGAWGVVEQTLAKRNESFVKEGDVKSSFEPVQTEFGPVDAAHFVEKIENKTL